MNESVTRQKNDAVARKLPRQRLSRAQQRSRSRCAMFTEDAPFAALSSEKRRHYPQSPIRAAAVRGTECPYAGAPLRVKRGMRHRLGVGYSRATYSAQLQILQCRVLSHL